MRKVIYISGITSSGKTTAAIKLGEFLNLPVFKADDVYSMIARELKHEKQEQLVMPEYWAKYEGFGQLKIKYYKELLKDVTGDFIIEGFPLFFEQDRQIIEKIIGEHFVTHFRFTIPFTIWKEWVDNKLGGDHSGADYLYLNKFFEAPKQFYTITDAKELFVTGDLYQRTGFTDKKWDLIGLKPNEIADKTIIDLGCNSGWIASNCLQNGAKMATGVDYNWRYLNQAREKGIEPIYCDLDEFEFDKKYDIVFCLSTFHYVRDKEALLKKIAEATNEMFILEIPVSQLDCQALVLHDTGKCQYYIPTEKLIKFWLSKYFEVIVVIGSVAPDNSYRLIFKCKKTL